MWLRLPPSPWQGRPRNAHYALFPYQSATVLVCMHQAQRRLQVKQLHGTASHHAGQWLPETPQDWVGCSYRLANPGCQRYSRGLCFSYAYAAKLRSALDADGQTFLCLPVTDCRLTQVVAKAEGSTRKRGRCTSPVLSCSHGLYCIRPYVDLHAYRHQPPHYADALVLPIRRSVGCGVISRAGIGAT